MYLNHLTPSVHEFGMGLNNGEAYRILFVKEVPVLIAKQIRSNPWEFHRLEAVTKFEEKQIKKFIQRYAYGNENPEISLINHAQIRNLIHA